jgi:DNA repair protein RAD5
LKYSKKKLAQLKLIGKADYIHVFTLLLRLRQICNHKLLVTANANADKATAMELSNLINSHEESSFSKDIFSQLQQNSFANDCPICFETSMEIVLLPCLHNMCKPCLSDLIQRRQNIGEELECPFCRKSCNENDLMQVLRQNSEQGGCEPNLILRNMKFSMSTKLEKLTSSILNIIQTTNEKIIVFRYLIT